MSDEKTQNDQEIEVKNYKPGEKAFMFGYNKIDVGVFGASDFKPGMSKYGVVCTKVVQKSTIETEDPSETQTVFTVVILDEKGEVMINRENQPMTLNVPGPELFTDMDALKSIIEEKTEAAIANAKTALNNSIVDAKSAQKRASKIIVPEEKRIVT